MWVFPRVRLNQRGGISGRRARAQCAGSLGWGAPVRPALAKRARIGYIAVYRSLLRNALRHLRSRADLPADLSDLDATGGLFRPVHANKEAEMANGTVKWFNSTKGYGFIQPEDGGKDVFVHVSAVERSGFNTLADGQPLTYEIERDRKSGKDSAVNLRLA
jgi:CspA family cold shock protein